ncbi:Translocon at the outer membrane of chloroplasts 64 [Platanthera zijinensis]|uniref:Translocon at the outer membrane of chloroplasts 64 n=1 Tax=Platanthera zijinensis TaxID=2320716 RepID=A0AAP0BD90_9ASPA
MSEWDHFRALSPPQGWSPRGGQGKSPYPGTDGPCGTSSGSAVAVAANLVTVALGTDLDGAITCPSTTNSVVGIKPTVGVTSRSGVVPISDRLDTVGPMARTVADAVAVLDVIAGFDPRDSSATRAGEKFIPAGGFRQFLKADGLKGKRIGILSRRFDDFEEKSAEAATFARFFDIMRNKGATVMNDLEIRGVGQMSDPAASGEAAELLAEFKVSLEAYLADLISSPVRTLADIIAFNNHHKEEERMEEFGQIIFLESEKTKGVGPLEKSAINRMVRLSKEGMEMLMAEKGLDALVFPNNVIHHALAMGGFPLISVPAGYAESGAPFGITFAGAVGSDAKLIEIAYAFEQATRARKPPPPPLS